MKDYRYSINPEVIIAAGGLDSAHRVALEVQKAVAGIEGVVSVGGVIPRHRNDLDHALPEKASP